jgi:hypothetical protein
MAISGLKFAQNSSYREPAFLLFLPMTSKKPLKCSKGLLVVKAMLNYEKRTSS